MKINTNFNRKFPNAKNIELGSNGIVWGYWFNNLDSSKRKSFYSIESNLDKIKDPDVLCEEEVMPTMINGLIDSTKICLN